MPAPVRPGLLVLDKPAGWTSREAVNRAQRWFPRGTRLGHAGTLDPLATGVLVLGVGQATRLLEYVQEMPKVYRSRWLLGCRSDTEDITGQVRSVPDASDPGRAQVWAVLQTFLGWQEQTPPAFSAAHIAGQRAYELARAGQPVALTPRRICIYRLEIEDYNYPHLQIEIQCSKGTYIRSLARDVGDRLGCGAVVAELRRTRLGPFTPEQAAPWEADAQAVQAHLLPPAAAVAALPRVVLPAPLARRWRQGQALPLAQVSQAAGLPDQAEVAVWDTQERLAGIGRLDHAHHCLRPCKVFPSW